MSWLDEMEAKDPFYHHCEDYSQLCACHSSCSCCCVCSEEEDVSAVDAEVSEG